MFIYWQHNKNIILAAVGLFIVSLTALLFFLTENVPEHADLKANVVDSVTLKSDMEQEKNYRNAMESSDGPFIVVEPDGKIDFMSWDYESMTGYTKPELQDQLFFSMVHPEDLPKIISAFGSVIAWEKASQMVGPFRVRDADGTYHLHMATIYPVMNEDKVEKLIFSSVDITQDVQGSETPAETEEVTDTPAPEPDQSLELMNESPQSQEEVVPVESTDSQQVKEEKIIKENPGNNDQTKEPSKGKKIRDEDTKGEKRLMVDKLAMLFRPLLGSRPKLLSWVPYFLPPM